MANHQQAFRDLIELFFIGDVGYELLEKVRLLCVLGSCAQYPMPHVLDQLAKRLVLRWLSTLEF